MKDIRGFPNYQISEDGKIFSKNVNRYMTTKIKNDYPAIILHRDGKKYFRYVHRLVAETYIDNLNNKPTINHKDGNKLNNNINNLEWVTLSENIKHAYDSGLHEIDKLHLAKIAKIGNESNNKRKRRK